MREDMYRRMLERATKPSLVDKLVSILSQDLSDKHKEYKAICIVEDDTACLAVDDAFKKAWRYRPWIE